MIQSKFTIGVLGGMGTYATVHLFKQYADIFEAEKEWDRPRIVIDNRCTMPSRVRAFLYSENVTQLVGEMTDSISHLMAMGANRIILACNTSHLFLPYIYEKLPPAKNMVLSIIDVCVKKLEKDNIKQIYLLASEGTIDSGIYQNALAGVGIDCIVPEKEEYMLLRNCIEAVKQNKYSDEVRNTFVELVNRYDACILGCTELPVLYEKYQKNVTCKFVYDPLELAVKVLKEEYEHA